MFCVSRVYLVDEQHPCRPNASSLQSWLNWTRRFSQNSTKKFYSSVRRRPCHHRFLSLAAHSHHENPPIMRVRLFILWCQNLICFLFCFVWNANWNKKKWNFKWKQLLVVFEHTQRFACVFFFEWVQSETIKFVGALKTTHTNLIIFSPSLFFRLIIISFFLSIIDAHR